MRFNGDIIITDPCYLMKDDNNEDWEKCKYGDNLEILGIDHYLCESTIYGDWSCTVYDRDSGKKIGQFCADAGLVCVCLLDQVLKYNPKYDDHINSLFSTTLIKNFDGDVSIECDGEEVSVVGAGNVKFYSRQTGA